MIESAQVWTGSSAQEFRGGQVVLLVSSKQFSDGVCAGFGVAGVTSRISGVVNCILQNIISLR